MKRLTRSTTEHNYAIYCDYFFTSATPVRDLLQDNIYACTCNATWKCYHSDLKGKAKSRLNRRSW